MFPNKIHIFIRVNGIPKLIKIKKLNKKNGFRYDKKDNFIDVSSPYQLKGRYTIYGWVLNEGQIKKEDTVSDKNDLERDIILGKEALRQLASASDVSLLNLNTIIFLIMGLVAGIMTGIVIAPFIGFGG